MSDHVALKGYQTRRDELLTEMNTIKNQVNDSLQTLNQLRDVLQQKQNRLNEIDREVTRLKQKHATPVITEHAFLRYFERVLGHDLEAIKQTILPPETVAQIQSLGNGVYPVKGAVPFRVRVQNNTVVTVTADRE
jgi:aspartate ammonia-lyase